MNPSPVVLVAIYTRHPYWRLPEAELARLRARFPGVTWLVDRTWYTGYGEGLERADVLFAWHLPRPELPRATRLRWVHSGATGIRRLLYPEWRARGVVLTGSRGVQAPFVAEHALALILALLRRLPDAVHAQRERRWSQDAELDSRPETLRGKRVLIVGYGSMAEALSRLLVPFGAVVHGVRRNPAAGGGGAARMTGPEGVEAELREADIVVDALPNTDATRGFFDAVRLAYLKRGAYFLNLGRGDTVDESALAERLRSGAIRGAALDVFTGEPLAPASPLWTAPGTLLTPHVAGAAEGIWPALVDRFAENLDRWLDGRPLLGAVDWDAGY